MLTSATNRTVKISGQTDGQQSPMTNPPPTLAGPRSALWTRSGRLSFGEAAFASFVSAACHCAGWGSPGWARNRAGQGPRLSALIFVLGLKVEARGAAAAEAAARAEKHQAVQDSKAPLTRLCFNDPGCRGPLPRRLACPPIFIPWPSETRTWTLHVVDEARGLGRCGTMSLFSRLDSYYRNRR